MFDKRAPAAIAPRRGGGRGGGGGGGGGGLSSPWGDKFQFFGTRFQDPLIRGYIIILAICALALLVIAIVAFSIKKTFAPASIKKTYPGARKVFAWFPYQFSIAMVIIAIGSDLASAIIRDSAIVVERIYILIEGILNNFNYLAEISLLATVYYLLTVYFLNSGEPLLEKPTKMIRALGWIHSLFLIVLLGLWVGIMYTSLRYRVEQVQYNYGFEFANTYLNLNLSYVVLYLCATIEILVWTVIAFIRSRNDKAKVNNLSLFLSLVAIPLLIRYLFLTSFAARTLKQEVTALALFINLLFTLVCTVLAYGGIICIAYKLEQAQRHYLKGRMAAVPGPPQNGYAPYMTPWQPGTQGPPLQGQVHPAPDQELPSPVSSVPPKPQAQPQPQMQESAYAENIATNSPGAPWVGQGHHPNGHAPTPQPSGQEVKADSQSVPIPRPY